MCPTVCVCVLIAELSRSFCVTLLWVKTAPTTQTHTLFPLLALCFVKPTHFPHAADTHTSTPQLCSIMSPPLTAPEKISPSLSSSAFLSLTAFLSPCYLSLFISLSLSLPLSLFLSPLSLSLIPPSCETMSCNNTELNLRVKAVFPLH